MDAIRCLGIANRGEAAVRCIRAVRSIRAREGSDLRALVIYTDVDRDAPFVRHADVAVHLPSRGSAVAAYLDHDLVLERLRRGGADAVWPGWGFLAEAPSFADRVRAAGMRFLGPTGETMRRLGDKIAAKLLAESAGVPVAPWSGGEVPDEEAAERLAAAIGYPLLVKATAGGGGRGIRVVESPVELREAIRSAAAEARSAFGDGRLFLERKIAHGRHVEVQIVADLHGHVFAVGSRDCSVQRRHQKVIEEAPPPRISAGRLAALEEAAVRLARTAGYSGLGTVEFLVSADGFYFLEVNPRLQVEHGVTEAVTGLDLVELQIRIARGEEILTLGSRTRGFAIEARVCAEDPEAGFVPSPGRVTVFDPPLGPGVRVDTGVAAGSVVPPDFDSLVAKVIATGTTREEACARLVSDLRDFELVIEGGATNKGHLIQILESADFRDGGVDVAWLDRSGADLRAAGALAAHALAAAAILAYQQARLAARINFFADAMHASPLRVTPSTGRKIDLTYGGVPYRLEVFALGSWRYRVLLDDRAIVVCMRDEGTHRARLETSGRTFRVLYDAQPASLRVEIEGYAYRFGRETAGQVTAATPAIVVAIHVSAGDRVEAGQPLGILEAMKMEIGFRAPVAGTVSEVRVRKGQQVSAGDPLLVIESAGDQPTAAGAVERPRFSEEGDALDHFFRGGSPDLRALDMLEPEARRTAVSALRAEIRAVLLGYDGDPVGAQRLVSLLESPPRGLSDDSRSDIAEVRCELSVFADVERLFVRTPRASASGELAPSNNEQLRRYLRRMRAGGAGVGEEFRGLLEQALGHYGIRDLSPGDVLERAILRLFASQRNPELRHRLVTAILRHLLALVRSGIDLASDGELSMALSRIARLRDLVPDALADLAAEAALAIFEAPELERRAARVAKRVDEWLATAEREPSDPPDDVMLHLAEGPPAVFERVARWIEEADPRRRAVALAAHLRRIYAPAVPLTRSTRVACGLPLEILEFPGDRVIIATAAPPERLTGAAELLQRTAREESARIGNCPLHATELFVPAGAEMEPSLLKSLLSEPACAERVTITAAYANRSCTFVRHPAGEAAERAELHGIHPEVAARIDLGRLSAFDLQPIDAPEGIHAFYARSREIRGDERIFVLAEVCGRSPDDGHEPDLHVAEFVRIFHEATRTLRAILGIRDPARRLQWNRISLFVTPEIFLEPETAESLARRLAPATGHLGLEKLVVRLRRLDRARPERPAEPVEIVFSNPTGSRVEVDWRTPHREPLRPASDYERRVVEARRRGLVYPYEIVRMLAGAESAPRGTRPAGLGLLLPGGTFEEFDLAPEAERPTAVRADRPPGGNVCGIVFGIVSTPTAKVPEGMRRVLLLSDPTREMGALAAEECERIVAAIDLAEKLGLPIEWVPVSAGARISMASGTENLDATARVVRRIVEFTHAGGVIHVVVYAVNVGAQSYFDALATMLGHTRGALIMTAGGSMVLTGRAALEASGSVAAEDEVAVGGFERIMGPNGQAQYYAPDLPDAFWMLYEHHRYTYVVPGERGPRRHRTADPATRPITDSPYLSAESDFRTVGEIFDDATNPGRKRPFGMRAVMAALMDQDGGHLERWRFMAGAETAIVWDAHLGGHPVCLIGIESRSVSREGYRPPDGPESWTGGTLFPLSSKKVARALNAASGNRPAVILANLSGFDGSPESMRKLQLEYGAEIADAVVRFHGPLLFVVVSRYHGGAYVVFSRSLKDDLQALALEGSFASVIGGSAAAAVVFTREVRTRTLGDARVKDLEERCRREPAGEYREALERTRADVTLEKQHEVAAEFDAVHTVERARAVGSLDAIVPPRELRARVIRELDRGAGLRRRLEATRADPVDPGERTSQGVEDDPDRSRKQPKSVLGEMRVGEGSIEP